MYPENDINDRLTILPLTTFASAAADIPVGGAENVTVGGFRSS